MSASTTKTLTATSKKAANFSANGLRNDDRSWKDIDVVPGIGPAASKRLAEIGFTKALHLVSQMMQFSCDKGLMKAWLIEKLTLEDGSGILAPRYINATVDALGEWCENHL